MRRGLQDEGGLSASLCVYRSDLRVYLLGALQFVLHGIQGYCNKKPDLASGHLGIWASSIKASGHLASKHLGIWALKSLGIKAFSPLGTKAFGHLGIYTFEHLSTYAFGHLGI